MHPTTLILILILPLALALISSAGVVKSEPEEPLTIVVPQVVDGNENVTKGYRLEEEKLHGLLLSPTIRDKKVSQFKIQFLMRETQNAHR